MQAYAIVKQFTASIAHAVGAGGAEHPVIWLVVNESLDAATAEDVFARFARGCQRFLGIAARLLGWLPEEQAIVAAAECRAPFVLLSPRCAAARAIGAMAAELENTARDVKHSDMANQAYVDQANVYASLPHARSESPVAARS
jgi:MinD-like ATPase involved in chromosome partitioning or flagellar assembly